MELNVYCDESYQDCMTSKNCNDITYMVIGSIWLKKEDLDGVKSDIARIKEKHNCFGELKWSKVSRKKISFYKDIIDLFCSYGCTVRFRCIIVEKTSIKWDKHEYDAELGFYKFYYQMLHHWISTGNNYYIYCDKKINRRKDNLKTLKNVLSNANIYARIMGVYSSESKQMAALQFADFFTGLVSAKFNNSISPDGAKQALIQYLEEKLGREIRETTRTESKFNVFNIKANGGW